MKNKLYPSVYNEYGLSNYIREISQYKILSQEEEYMLAKRVAEHQDPDAAHTLITSHLRLVVKIAMGMKSYGLSMMDMIAEGNIGLMHSIKKFDPDMGYRLSTYAMWWIKASIQEFIVKSWSLVKIGTTVAQKKLFFNLNKLKNKIQSLHGSSSDLSEKDINKIAKELNVNVSDVKEMEQRILKDVSLDNVLSSEDSGITLVDVLEDKRQNYEEILSDKSELDRKRVIFFEAMANLNEREREIFSARNLKDNPETLEELSQRFGISRERVRQIEVRSMEKVREFCLA
jgi:RNA polymerase sigma-32 factor